MIFGKKSSKEDEKLRKPQGIPGLVQKYLVAEYKLPGELAPLLKAVVHKSAEGESSFDIRIYDDSEAEARKVKVNDYTTLNDHPELILYEGSFDETVKKVELQEKKKVQWDTPISTEAEIREKIEALNQPGSTVFFYMAAGSAHGGPLAMGAAVIELNADYPGKKQKKYNIYMADVVDMQPVGKGTKLFDTDKAKDISKWVTQSHHKRLY